MINITREQLQYGIGTVACLAVIVIYCIPSHVFNMGMAGFGLVALGVANVSDYFNSPPGKTT